MLSALLRFSIARRGVVLVAALAVVAYGVFLLGNTGLDIFPEFAPKLVIVQTEAPGSTAEQVEVLVSQPLEAALGGLLDLDHIRSESIQGLSVITVVFAEHSDVFRNRNQVNERLLTARSLLPASVHEPVIAPLASSSATVRTIGVTAGDGDLMHLRRVTESVIVPRLLGLAGVADVNVFGGEERALLIEPDVAQLARHGVTLGEVVHAARAASANPGLGVIENSRQQLAITVTGEVTPAALASTSVRFDGVNSLRLDDLAAVRWGALPRISAAQIMGQPAVVMMVIGQYGANTLTVSNRLDEAFADLTPVLAQQGVTLHARLFVPANYITTAIGDISRHLLIGGALVLGVLLVGLYDLRTALISAVAIPLSLLAAAIVLIVCGIKLNVLVIGGLAIALGEVVDDAIIDTENIHRRLRRAAPEENPADVALAASLEVRGSVVYATFIVTLVFVPLLTLGGVSGRLFAPLGLAYILAVSASLLVAVTVTPALCVALLGGRRREARAESPAFRVLNPIYTRLVAALARRPRAAMAASLACFVVVLAALPGFGARFLPDLREGHFIVHTTALPGTSLDESIRIGTRLTEEFLRIEGVKSVSQWAGRAARGADTYGSHYSEYEVALEPLAGSRQQAVLEALRSILARFPGLTFEANTFLTERIDETISGYTAPVVVNLYGADLDALDAKARELGALMQGIAGADNVRIRAAHDAPALAIRLDPERLSSLGVTPAAALHAVQMAYAGQAVDEVYADHRRVPLVVMLDERARSDAGAVAGLVITRGDSGVVRLGDVATVEQRADHYNILHRGGQRLQVVTANVVGRDLEAFMQELRARVFAELHFAEGMHAEFTGAAVEQSGARRELIAHALIAGLGVLLLITMAVNRPRYLALILFNLPFSLVGGVVAVMLGGAIVSIGSVVGFVTLFGITVRNSIMLVSHYQHLVDVEGCRWNLETLLRGARERLPAILMTALVTALAMLPLTIASDNPGREIMGPMAAIIIGGLISSTILNLLIMPALLYRYGRFGEVDGRG